MTGRVATSQDGFILVNTSMNISKNAIEGKTKTNIKQAVKLGHLEHLILFCSNYNSWEPEKHMEQHLFIKQVKPGISAWLLARGQVPGFQSSRYSGHHLREHKKI